MTTQQDKHMLITSYQNHAQSSVIMREDSNFDSLQYVLRLLWTCQTVSKQTTHVAEWLCKEIVNITQGKAQLILHNPDSQLRTIPTLHKMLFSFSVQFGEVIYGTLCIASDTEQPTTPAIPFAIAQLLAQICSWLLHTFEQSLFLQGQCQHLDKPAFVSLTKREREVLTLMCLGDNQQHIADKLSISPTTVGKHRQHIYEQLGVHNEHDALLAAYHYGFFSILDLPKYI